MTAKKRTPDYASIDRYNLKTYARIDCRLPKDLVAAFKAKCATDGTSQAAIIRAAIEDYLGKTE